MSGRAARQSESCCCKSPAILRSPSINHDLREVAEATQSPHTAPPPPRPLELDSPSIHITAIGRSKEGQGLVQLAWFSCSVVWAPGTSISDSTCPFEGKYEMNSGQDTPLLPWRRAAPGLPWRERARSSSILVVLGVAVCVKLSLAGFFIHSGSQVTGASM